MKIGASLVLLVAPTVIGCAAAVPVGVGKAYKNAHTTNPNGVFRKRDSPLRSNARNLRISGCVSNFERAQTARSPAHVLLTVGFARGHPARVCERHQQDLAPKWLDPRQGRMRVGCTLQNRVEAGVFATRQQSRGEGALRVASPAIAVMRFSWTAMSLRSPKQSCTLSSPERNFSRRFDAFLPGKTAAKNSDAYRTFLA